ncbi:hypothetical protein BH20ACT2_BH20ACT2_21220 [soil metagenome]
MRTAHRRPVRVGAIAGLLALAFSGLGFLSPSPAGADPVATGSASGYGITAALAGNTLIPPTPQAAATLPPGGDDTETTINVPAAPLAVNGTLTATANAHEASDIESALTSVTQDVAGPYNTRGFGQVEGLEVLLDVAGVGVPLLDAEAVTAEAVAVCSGGSVQYSANSEVVSLSVAGNLLPLNGPVSDLVDAISGLLQQSGLDAVVNAERNVVTNLDGGGIAVDALQVSVLSALGDPLVALIVGHAEVGPSTCGAGDLPECSDGIDNDGDGFIDFPNDPECDSPDDDKEAAECVDTVDNDGDGLIDGPADPGCEAPFERDDDERDGPGDTPRLARTGGDDTGMLLGGGLLLAAGLAELLRRKSRLSLG